LIPLNQGWPSWPIHTAETAEALAAVLTSRRWSVSGAWTGRTTREQEFAGRWAEFNGVPYCVPTANGSSSLLISLEALDVGAGDEVIVPAMTWVAPATAVLNVNARPVIVDVDPRTLCLDVSAVKAAITPRTKAIIAVHLYGSMVDMDPLMALAKAHGVAVIEDCAQSHGSRYGGRSAGSIGDTGIFSMHQGKVLTSGEGGATITSSQKLFRRLEQLRSDGRRYVDHTPKLGAAHIEEVGEIQGSNFCLSEFQAAVLLDGLTRLPAQNLHRAGNAKLLDQKLTALGGLTPQGRPAAVEQQTYYHYLVRCDPAAFAGRSSAAIARALQAELGFVVAPPYPALPRHRLYCPQTKRRFKLDDAHWAALDPSRFATPVATRAHAECVVFHHSVLLAEASAMDTIVEAFEKLKRSPEQIPTDLRPQ
jgi:L-glutamine:2-deoxy-scyllo-inosose/3-amino-2,3-dideoxy-scyllo-inosose aminotransferase